MAQSTNVRLAYSTTTPTPAQRLHSSLNPDVLVHRPAPSGLFAKMAGK